jgi:hypothetical protein
MRRGFACVACSVVSAMALLVASFFFAPEATAHDNHGGRSGNAAPRRQTRRITGTLTAVDDSRIELRKKNGPVVDILLDDHTQYRRGKSRASSLALDVGAEVSVEAWSYGDSGELTAKTITVDKPPKPPAGETGVEKGSSQEP